MSRVRAAFEGRKALVIYLTQGDPSPAESVELVVKAAEAGADVIELGVPFSDPNADGVVIQEAMQRALAAGGGMDSALHTVRAVRARGCDVPLVLFGYYNPIFVRGAARFAREAADAGVDAVLTVDLPIDEMAELSAPLADAGVEVVPLVAPTSGLERVKRVRELAPPFVYYISMTGITGAEHSGFAAVKERVEQVRAAAGAPVAVGFGVKTADDARVIASFADGVVVGSQAIRVIQSAPADRRAEALADYVRTLRAAMQ